MFTAIRFNTGLSCYINRTHKLSILFSTFTDYIPILIATISHKHDFEEFGFFFQMRQMRTES